MRTTLLREHFADQSNEQTNLRGIAGRTQGQNRSGLLNSSEVADWLGIAQRTVCLWAELQEIPAFKLGHQWRFHEDEVLKWLQSHTLISTRRSDAP
jgi:excisionase family DNA binding protein